MAFTYTHAEINSDGFLPYFREYVEGVGLMTEDQSSLTENSLNLRVHTARQFYDFGLVDTYRAEIVTCHIENLPEQYPEDNWDHCLQSTSGNTYMFVQRKYCFGINEQLGAAQHAILLQEGSAPGQYQYILSERRVVIVTSLAAASNRHSVKDLKQGYMLQNRLSKECEFICGFHECTYDNQNLYAFLRAFDSTLSDFLCSNSGKEALGPDLSCQALFRQIMQGRCKIHCLIISLNKCLWRVSLLQGCTTSMRKEFTSAPRRLIIWCSVMACANSSILLVPYRSERTKMANWSHCRQNRLENRSTWHQKYLDSRGYLFMASQLIYGLAALSSSIC
jgi:hypothetical protein